MVSFGLAKTLNALISLVQGTQLTLTPAGVGVNLSVGEVLDPFNDMVERFSWVMLFATVSLGIQKLLLILSAKSLLKILLIVSAMLALFFLWFKDMRKSLYFSYSLKLFLLFFILRFSAIIFIYSSEYIHTSLMQEDYLSSNNAISATKERLEDLQTLNTSTLQSTNEMSFFDSFNHKYEGFTQAMNISKRIEALEENINEATLKIINLITIFVVESLILPLLFLWLFLQSIKLLYRVEVKLNIP